MKKEIRIVGKLTLRRDDLIEIVRWKELLTKRLYCPNQKPQTFSVVKKHCAKCGRTNHDTTEYRIGTR